MESVKRYESYPAWIVVLSNLNSALIYLSGFLIVIKLGLVYSLIYLFYVSIFEFRVIRYHCINCYYWGKTCGFARGRISALLFKKGDSAVFCMKDFGWKDMIPDILLSLIPLLIGIILLIIKFDLILLFVVLSLLLLTSIGNGFIRGKLTCQYCKQKDLGCPADLLFNKEK
jgi:hypothetical protein